MLNLAPLVLYWVLPGRCFDVLSCLIIVKASKGEKLVIRLWEFQHVIGQVHGFSRQMEHFLTNMSNRVEHQKLNQTTAELSFG